jgi:hypothetical protein
MAVRLIGPLVPRTDTDAPDAAAICEAMDTSKAEDVPQVRAEGSSPLILCGLHRHPQI